jgi:hypothetical protein
MPFSWLGVSIAMTLERKELTVSLALMEVTLSPEFKIMAISRAT